MIKKQQSEGVHKTKKKNFKLEENCTLIVHIEFKNNF